MDSTEISFPIFGEGFVIDPPSYITIFGFNLYIYGLFITFGFILAGLYIFKRRNTLGLTQDNVLDLIILTVPSGIVGARIYYAIFNFSDYFGAGNWLNIFKLREGGLAIYGGVIGGAIAIYIYSRVKKVPVGKLLDAAGFGLLIGQAVGRWGNFFNREAFGTATDLPWKMGLRSSSGFIYVHPTFLYESLWNTVGLVLIHLFSKKAKVRYSGQYFLLYVAWYGFGRYMIEGLRTDSLFISGTDIRISQLLAALSFSAAVVLLIRNRLRGVRSPTNSPTPVLAGSTENGENAECGMRNAELSDGDYTVSDEIQDSTDEDANDNADEYCGNVTDDDTDEDNDLVNDDEEKLHEQ